MTSEVLSNRELRRYKNQIILPEIGIEGQEKIKKAKVVVIGTGGIGTSVMQYLVVTGIGTLGIIDNDLVDETNIHRQTIYGTADLGKQKTIISRQKLHNLNAQVNLNVHNLCISYENMDKICHDYDLIVDASNFFETNMAIWSYCQQYNKPLVYGRISEYDIEIGIYSNKDELKNLIEKKQDVNNVSRNGFLSPIAGITGALMSIEVIFFITGTQRLQLNKTRKLNILSSFII